MKTVFGLLVSFLLSAQAFALSRSLSRTGEGFSTEAPPAALVPAWKNTFAFRYQHLAGIFAGTLFPIAKAEVSSKHLVLFVTAGHNYRVLNGFHFVSGDQVSISRNLQIDLGNHLSLILEPLQFKFTSASFDAGSDTAAIVLEVPGGAFDQIHCLKLTDVDAKPGSKVFLFGFPNAVSRVGLTNELTKRWSRGIVLFQRGFASGESGEDRLPLMTSTADTLPGDSGGPVLNLSGEVVGMLVGGLKSARYSGSEVPFREKPYSYLVPASYVKVLAGILWQQTSGIDL